MAETETKSGGNGGGVATEEMENLREEVGELNERVAVAQIENYLRLGKLTVEQAYSPGVKHLFMAREVCLRIGNAAAPVSQLFMEFMEGLPTGATMDRGTDVHTMLEVKSMLHTARTVLNDCIYHDEHDGFSREECLRGTVPLLKAAEEKLDAACKDY